MTTFSQLKAGDKGRIKGFGAGSQAYRHRLMAMGLTKGIQFIVERIAPLGDPILVRVRGSSLSLRKHEASVLQVEKVDDGQ